MCQHFQRHRRENGARQKPRFLPRVVLPGQDGPCCTSTYLHRDVPTFTAPRAVNEAKQKPRFCFA
jgi:hypothetical protein